MLIKLKKTYSEPFLNETRSISSILIYRMLCWFVAIIYKLKNFNKLKRTREFLKKESEEVKKLKKCAFVFANGPSMTDIDLDKISKLCINGNYDLIAINSYLSKSANLAKPTYAIFADNKHFENPQGQFKDDIDKCKELGIKYFSPAKFVFNNEENRLAYCSICNIDGDNTNNILEPAGYYGMTAFFALSLAAMIGYEKIYICGFDNSYFLDFEVEKNGEMCINHKHYYDVGKVETKVKCLYKNSSEFFFDTYRHFKFLEKIYIKNGNIYNIAKKTYLNTIPVCEALDVYKSIE